MQAGARVHVYTLGTFQVLVDGCALHETVWRRRSARQLFKLLLTRPGRSASRDEVIELFWPESNLDAAASNLRSTVWAMRRALQPGSRADAPRVISGDNRRLWLGPVGDLWTDADAFEELVASSVRTVEPLPLLEQASALYAGDYLPDDLYEDWATERRDALRRTWNGLQLGLAHAYESRSDVNAALQPLERLLRADAADERAAGELMRILTHFGRRAEASRVFQRLTQSLRDELGVDPSHETVELWNVVNAGQSTPPGTNTTAAFRCTYPFPSPIELVGREAELNALLQIVASGRTAGQVVFVSAPPGMGKSALVGELVARAQADGVLCLAGGCYAEGGAVPFGPFHDALVDYLLTRSPEQLRLELAGSGDDLAELIPELRYHLQLGPGSADATPDVDRTRAFGAIHACLRSLADGAALLVCLEDLHAADEPTLQVLHYLARQTRRLPIVLLATFRDDIGMDPLLGQTVAALLRERLAERVTLGPLGRDQFNQLARLLLAGPPSPALDESLYATAGGNPLFLEELILALMEGALL
ncbi:MAG: AAA family ATPase, partial [Chloroflexi bacterium]|nr:AAA family ATPase [Chloroflexota bacterium]